MIGKPPGKVTIPGTFAIPGTVPRGMFCEYASPLASLYLWGYPTAANSLELWTWQQLAQFVTINDNVVLPPAYIDMLVYNLAVRLADQFPTLAQMSPNVAIEARRILGRVKAINLPSPPIPSADYGAEGRPLGAGGFNYMTGGPS